ncbi:uncharacterized protein VTP21DRAFT_4249 [Calcarisporiella thermophila]|uniref:uncharacterized protein n=1 Tax=Calcarisporiella thermophila TaxID=911321 RepID=UPI00374360A4
MDYKKKRRHLEEVARQRLELLSDAFSGQKPGRICMQFASSVNENGETTIRIGDISLIIRLHPSVLSLVPYVPPQSLPLDSQPILRHLRWMLQKDALGLDMFLIGPPGPLRRLIALKYAELTRREVEYVVLSKDVTSSDLKQRRELRDGTAYFVDGPAVRAAVHGRLLVLDGIEKAERNVLPLLNNLLENREMALEDGRFLMQANRFDKLQRGERNKETMNFAKLERVDPKFLVIALGVPVPRYSGYPLDPPLRSRFQSRDIRPLPPDMQATFLSSIAPNAPHDILKNIASVAAVLGPAPGTSGDENTINVGEESNIPEFPASIDVCARILNVLPGCNPRFLLDLVYPYPVLPTCSDENRKVIEAAYQRFNMLGESLPEVMQHPTGYSIIDITRDSSSTARVRIRRVNDDAPNQVEEVLVPAGPQPFAEEFFVETPYHHQVISALLIAHSKAGDICIIGSRGVGKSVLVRHFARTLGYSIEFIPLHRDMSARELLQRRSTSFAGDTVWENSPLVRAAVQGRLAVMDGIETLGFGTLASLQRLMSDREIPLPDGRRLMSWRRYDELQGRDEKLVEGVLRIHPSFRIISLARPQAPSSNGGVAGGDGKTWLSPEIVSMFSFITMRSLTIQEETQVLESVSPGMPLEKLDLLLKFANKLRHSHDETVRMLSNSLSTRQLIRICRRIAAFPKENLHAAIHKVSMSRFLPSLAREALEDLLRSNGILPEEPFPIDKLDIELLPSRENPKVLRIGDVEQSITPPSNPVLVPNVLFHENSAQTVILREMLKDYQLGEHLLLVGNQGVGKNKLADYFLQLLQLPREYIQLHRDTTVQSLTAIPSIVEGVLQYEDSALVRAVREGYILVVDEADKAPTYVTAVLRNLLEDGQMVLGDGRRIVRNPADAHSGDDEETIIIHENFRMIVLANRPGYPFLGNDFYREIGDVFSCYAVDNPDSASELYLLTQYGPNVPHELLEKLSNAFTDLRRLVDEGMISYPYSTRELVNIVRHLQAYPEEGVSRVLQNVFDFDQYDQSSRGILVETFRKHGIPIGLELEYAIRLGKQVDLVRDDKEWQIWRREEKKSPIFSNTSEINFRGGWDLDAAKAWNHLERFEGRTVTFSEQLYSFKLPTRGDALDIVGLEDGALFAVTTNPVTLHWVDQGHKRINSFDLYEFFPLQKNPPRIRLAIVSVQNNWFLLLHNPADHALLSCDMQRNSVTAITITGFLPQSSIMVKDLSHIGLIGFFQRNQPKIVILDFNTNTQHTLELPIKVDQVHMLEANVWLVKDALKHQHHIVYREDGQEGLPNCISPVEVKGYNSRSPTINYISPPIHMDPKHAFSDRVFTIQDSSTNPRTANVIALTATQLPSALLSSSRESKVTYFRREDMPMTNGFNNLLDTALYLRKTGQLAVASPLQNSRSEGILELVNLQQEIIWRITIPLAIPSQSQLSADTPALQFPTSIKQPSTCLLELPSGQLLTMDTSGMVRVWQVDPADILQSANNWKRMVGSLDDSILSIIYGHEKPEEKVHGALSLEEISRKEIMNQSPSDMVDFGDSGMSGMSGMGGMGGMGGEGEGGSGGGEGGEGGSFGGGKGGSEINPDALNLKGREASFVDVSTLTLRTANEVPKEVSETHQKLHEMAMQLKLSKLGMTEKDVKMFQSYFIEVQREIRELRVILESVEAKKKERVWLKNQTTGDVDDTKLIEGLTGETSIYRRRGEDDPELGAFQEKPKRMYFCFDLSASMFRFTTHDRRLERSLQVALMLMEAFRGFEHKFAYSLYGHSGDGAFIPFVQEGAYPRNEMEMYRVLQAMYAHAQFCLSGDSTLAATQTAIREITKGEEADDYFVVILSDANLQQYALQPSDLSKALKADDRVNGDLVFIGSLHDQAEKLKNEIGQNAHICMENRDLPRIVKSIFLHSMLKM